MFLNVFAGFVNLGKSEKKKETLANFSEKIQVFEKERKKKIKIYTLLPHYLLKIC